MSTYLQSEWIFDHDALSAFALGLYDKTLHKRVFLSSITSSLNLTCWWNTSNVDCGNTIWPLNSHSVILNSKPIYFGFDIQLFHLFSQRVWDSRVKLYLVHDNIWLIRALTLSRLDSVDIWTCSRKPMEFCFASLVLDIWYPTRYYWVPKMQKNKKKYSPENSSLRGCRADTYMSWWGSIRLNTLQRKAVVLQ